MNGLLRATSKFKVCSAPNSTRRASREQSLPNPTSPTQGGKSSWEGAKLTPTHCESMWFCRGRAHSLAPDRYGPELMPPTLAMIIGSWVGM